ncbi:MAG: outer membrane lipoprotein-sorting protein [Alphaproteobacteria bacterium]|nr:outer membrane lipoprotein-sorting protein [Alphaproteobacteria bacterium]
MERFAEFVVNNRIKVAIVTMLLAFGVFAGIPNLKLDTDGRVFMAADNPDKIRLDRFEQEFAKDDNLAIIIVPADGEVFTPRTLGAIGAMTEDLWNLPYVRLVNSITRFQNTYADGDMMVVEDLVPEPDMVTDEDAAAARAVALDRIEIRNSLINEDASATAISVIFRLPGIDLVSEIPNINAEFEPLLEKYRAAYPDIQFKASGSVAISQAFATASQKDGETLTPAMLVAMLVIVGVLLRSATGSLLILILATLSALVSLGALGWTRIPINSATAVAPLMVITLAVASSVHVLSSVRQTMQETADRTVWARRAIIDHGLGISVAVFTTAIGFLSLNFSISPPFRQLGNMVAGGMIGVWIFTMFLLPGLICWLPIKQNKRTASVDSFMVALGEFVIRHQKRLLIGIPVVIIAFGAGISQIKLEDDFLRYFDESFETRQATDLYETELGGLNVLEYSVDTGVENGINSVEYLQTLNDLSTFLRDQPEISHIRSLSDTIKRLNMNMNSDDPAYYRIPESDEEASQFLFLYELSLGYGMDLTDQINVDRSSTRVSAFVGYATTRQLIALDEKIQSWFSENAPELKSPVTGQTHVYTMISARDVPSMLQGTSLALVFISFVIFLVLRNFKLGLVSLVPNLVPAIMGFGLWGYMVGNVTLAVSIVVAMTLGIVVDDTVHFILKYANARKRGDSAEDSVRYAFKSVGMALTVTSLGLVIGFAILGQSGFAVNRDMARLTAITLSFALFVDFLFLPPLLIFLDRMKTMKTSTATTASLAAVAVIAASLAIIPMTGANASNEKGLAIATEVDSRDKGWGDVTVEGEMVLKNKAGNESVRKFRSTILEAADAFEGDRSIITFSEPRDVRGTALLTHSKIEPDDDSQWIFLPAVKRVKRISSSNRTGKFVSSEFSYEDLGSEEVADNDHIWLEDAACEHDASLTCAAVESRPKNKRSGYSRRVSFIDLDEYRVHRIDFYNRRGDLEKSLRFEDYRQYEGQFWRAHVMIMDNSQTGKSTRLAWGDYSFRQGLTERDFTPQGLPKASR